MHPCSRPLLPLFWACAQIKDLLAKHLRQSKATSSATTLAVQGGYVATGTDKGEVCASPCMRQRMHAHQLARARPPPHCVHRKQCLRAF